METDRNFTEFINFLQDKLAISEEAIALALRHIDQKVGPLHMILWLYGLVSIEQLQQNFYWLEYSTQFNSF